MSNKRSYFLHESDLHDESINSLNMCQINYKTFNDKEPNKKNKFLYTIFLTNVGEIANENRLCACFYRRSAPLYAKRCIKIGRL